ncbi:MAG: ATP-binding protein [Myxococcales bacterium]
MLLIATRVEYAAQLASTGELDVRPPAMRRAALAGALIIAVLAIAGLAYWDEERESAAALQDFAQEQVTLAAALGAALRTRSHSDLATHEGEILAELRPIERANALSILLRPPGQAVLHTTSGRSVSSPRLLAALHEGSPVVRIPREEAAEFGLPARTALAGLFRVDAGISGAWDVVAVASAERQRDREGSARHRLILSVFTAAGLVLAFGGIAMRLQRNELVLERELAVSALQQKRDERLQRADRAAVLGTLAMGVAHEISTPLGIIAARAEQMIPKVETDERLAGSIRSILQQTDGIKEVIRGLMGLARGDAPSAQRIISRTLIDNAVALVEHRFSKAGVQLVQEVDSALPTLIGDPRLIEHAIVNLLLNACEACKSGGDVCIMAKRRGEDLEIIVEDSGAGISLADIGRAREPFFTTKAREGGTGLGLAIAHEIVASHRGTLGFSARQPRGTRAFITLPPAEGAAHG